MRFKLKLVPQSSRTAIAGWMGDVLKIRVIAAPERGKANHAACVLLAEALGITKEQVRIVRGAGSARKRVDVDGLNIAEIHRRLMKTKASV